jgi:ABC-2 type transport system permease protein
VSGLFAVFQKEVRAFFNSPIAYIVVVGFLVFTSVWFFVVQDFFARDVASLRGYFGIMPIVFIVLVPAMTMRSWSEERRSGTDELLLTEPLGEAELVVGKYLGALLVLALAVALTVFVPLSVAPLGDFERGETAGQYLGLLLLGSAALGLGQLVSSLSRNQISAFLFTALLLLVLVLVARLNGVVELPGWAAQTLNYLSIEYHFRSFNSGVVDTRDAAYFIALTALSLFLTTRVLILRKIR